MNTIKITSPDNIEIEYRLAGAGSRLSAAIIDMTIQLLASAILFFIIFFAFGNNFRDLFYYGFKGISGSLIIFFSFIINYAYFIIIELLTNGQSIGKKIFKLRVIRENGQPIGFLHSFLRNLFRYVLDNFAVGLFSIMFHKKCKRVGDMVASTIVVSENANQIKTEQLSFHDLTTTQEKTLQAVQFSAVQFSKEEIERFTIDPDEYYLLNEYFSRRDSFMDGGRLVKDKLSAYFGNKFPDYINEMNDEMLYRIWQLNKNN